MATVSEDAIAKRGEIRAKVKALIQAGPAELAAMDVLFSREQPQSYKFINVYFLAGDVQQSRRNRDDSGRLVVRIACRSSADIDQELDNIAKLVVQQLGEPVSRLEGLVSEFSEVRWEYGAPEGSSVTFLALIYNIEY